MPTDIHIGAAGWQLPKEGRERFPAEGTHLERYGRVLNGVEINTTFRRSHQPRTYEKWANAVPEHFAFAIKAPRQITHDCEVVDIDEALESFLTETSHLGDRRGPVLFQLPPRLAFDKRAIEHFCKTLRDRYEGPAVLEPRHNSWNDPAAEQLLTDYRVARAAVDPTRFESDADPGGWPAFVYYRLHGSPRMYYSAYDADFLESMARTLERLRQDADEVWCIFDNTAAGAGVHNALDLTTKMGLVFPVVLGP